MYGHMAERTGKNCHDCLTESAVFLQPGGARSLSRSRPSLLRGLLVLELELIGKTSNTWPEGKSDRNPEFLAADISCWTSIGAQKDDGETLEASHTPIRLCIQCW